MNKFYIQIVFFLLSVSVYLNNRTLATESAPENATKTKSKNSYATSEEIYEKNKHQLCTDSLEIRHATNVIFDAVEHLKYHAKSKNYDYVIEGKPYDHMLYCEQNFQNNINVKKIKHTVDNPNKYNDVINEAWDPDHPKFFDTGDVERKIVRVYNPNLVLIQQRYKNWRFERQKYFYALAAKARLSEDVAVIIMASPIINDHNPSKRKYKNKVIKSANLFEIEIDSEDDIREGKLQKTSVNVAGYYIEKTYYGYFDVTYIESIDKHGSI
ncbi:fam-a protein [Plasmodium chabaudi adami]|uniref:Fam-a protein n=1 Tax=Plasmodium chabaudi adami TaxID=5826 RepID=A0A1C6WGA3_PLACE|nr:fam-a protein [Plasmodium chabaudi adami]